jgi:hypothetical protein
VGQEEPVEDGYWRLGLMRQLILRNLGLEVVVDCLPWLLAVFLGVWSRVV